MNYEPVIGLEVHVELNTKSKMFCRCSADYFGKEPNTHTCPVCLGLPGALPYINKAAIEGCIKIGLALGCEVSEVSRFERKNYFYPDLAKGYQISQYRWPLCVSGRLEIENGRWIRINRVHQEEDTGKLSHLGGGTLIDFNRSGVPLVEIVTEPDFHDSSEVRDFAKKLQQMFRYLGVSNADMEKGDMRLEANVSVRRSASHSSSGSTKLPDYRIELKNINSFKFMVAAIEYEIKRQIEALERGEKLVQETRGWDENKKETYLQRSKEEAHDYRYFPEPDLPELRIKNQELRIKEEMLELPWEKKERFQRQYQLSKYQAVILADSKDLADFFEEAIKLGEEKNVAAKDIANYIINKKHDMNTIKPDKIVEEIAQRGVGVISDETEIKKMIEEVISENPNLVEAYKKGKIIVIQALIGAVMKKSGGKVNIVKAREILGKKLLKTSKLGVV